jgi:hypothetical protein
MVATQVAEQQPLAPDPPGKPGAVLITKKLLFLLALKSCPVIRFLHSTELQLKARF